MGVSLYNAERYRDPTAYEALNNIVQQLETRQRKHPYMPKVFICSPYAGDIKRNIINAKRYCSFAVSSGFIPFAPHLFFPRFMKDMDTQQRELALFMGAVFMDTCKEVWVFGDSVSPGMSREIARARYRGIRLRFFNDRCEEVIRNAIP